MTMFCQLAVSLSLIPLIRRIDTSQGYTTTRSAPLYVDKVGGQCAYTCSGIPADTRPTDFRAFSSH